MTWFLVVLHVGLYIVVIVQTLAISVLYYQNSKLIDLAKRKPGFGIPLGAKVPHFKAVDIRSGNITNTKSFQKLDRCILFVSSNCFTCQKLVDDFTNNLFESKATNNLIIYCQGSRRGCASFLSGLDTSILTLTEYDSDVAELYHIHNVPTLVCINSSWCLSSYSYPFSARDICASINEN